MNLHTHTNYCDGNCDPVEYYEKAIELNWEYIGFSTHAPLPIQCDWDVDINDVNHYINELNSLRKHYKNKIQSYIGWEIDFLYGRGFPALENEYIQKADFFVCSIHYLPILTTNNTIIEYIEIDGTFDEFNRLYTYYNKNITEVLDLYLLNLNSMLNIHIDKTKIIGHIDKIVINAEKYPEFKQIKSSFYNTIFELLKTYSSESFVLEINTRGIYNKNRNNPYPAFEFIELIKDSNFQIMLNSDAHHPCELDQGFEQVKNYLFKNKIELNMIDHGYFSNQPLLNF